MISKPARRRFRSLAAIGFAFAATLGAVPTHAQGFPDRPIRFVVGAPAGSGLDFTARLVAEGFAKLLGQPVIVENRAGADGMIAARQVASAPADGYTLLVGTSSQFAINPATYLTLPYDPQRDFAPAGQVSRQAVLVVVPQSLEAHTMAELVARARARPRSINYGAGSSSFMLSGEALKQATGADMQHIPYNGGIAVVNALLAGDIQVGIVEPASVMGAAHAGRVRVLAVSSARRMSALPDVPTLAEAGVGMQEMPLWIGLFAPAGTSESVIARINAAIFRVVESADVRDRMVAAGSAPDPTSADELARIVKRDAANLEALAQRVGIVKR
ncbi:MAG: tripartite tricarboxylate transporter substrate binding protein [Betaproteobacteria bacterium]